MFAVKVQIISDVLGGQRPIISASTCHRHRHRRCWRLCAVEQEGRSSRVTVAPSLLSPSLSLTLSLSLSSLSFRSNAAIIAAKAFPRDLRPCFLRPPPSLLPRSPVHMQTCASLRRCNHDFVATAKCPDLTKVVQYGPFSGLFCTRFGFTIAPKLELHLRKHAHVCPHGPTAPHTCVRACAFQGFILIFELATGRAE